MGGCVDLPEGDPLTTVNHAVPFRGFREEALNSNIRLVYLNCKPSGVGSPWLIFETFSLKNSSALRCRISSSYDLNCVRIVVSPRGSNSGFR